ncbi:methyl-accepting chemotaxis protein [Cellulomonas bogoriensis]|uniref:Chemotaxis protein n=1 Tax=Cellulomonas bogoriensis 69B4 = DSM 16987 TaxID=1386082 RepID=A0A0A0BWW2_9CELL|nr:methyl-accepting chemotaxis protein [Cellulomonas bogoriensis]KGM12411.1 chemotaxis protein [Cellulomonas bogoriensis 69B4 = DSM 16987]
MSLDPRRSLHARLIVSFALVSLMTLALGAGGVAAMRALADRADDVYTSGAAPANTVRGIEVAYWTSQAASARGMLPDNPPEMTEMLLGQAAEMDQVMVAELEAALAMPLSADARTALEDFSTTNDERVVLLDLFEQTLASGDIAGGYAMIEQLSAQEEHMNELLTTASAATAAHAQSVVRDARDTYETAFWIALVTIVGMVAASMTLGVLVARRVGGPLRRFVAVLNAMAEGDLSARASVRGKDEIAQMGEALNHSLEAMGAVVRVVGDSAERLGSSARGLSSSTGLIVTNLSEASQRAGVVAGAADLVSQNVSTVSVGAQQMGASIQEIARNATEAATVAAQATSSADATNQRVARLGESSQEIGNVVKTISSIAEQTNLLALNATIEAARAGEAGKGFAVVAGEVKDLAQETAKATEDIARRVEAIQADTTGAVEAIAEISEVIARINDYQATIASAVEEQTATTEEMNRHVGEAAGSSGEIAGSINSVAQATQLSTDSAQGVEDAARQLAQMSDELQTAVRHFAL